MARFRVYIDAMPLAERRISGIGHLTLELTRALARRQDVELVLVVPLRKKALVARHGIGAAIRTIPMPARLLSILLRLRILPALDLLLGKGTYLFPNYRNWPLAHSKSLTYIHDASFALYPETVSPKNLRYLQHNIRLWSERADRVLTLSQSSKKDIIHSLNINEDKVRVIDCGVDARMFYERSVGEVEETKRKYDIADSNYILYVGNFEPRKNLDRLLSAYRKLPQGIRSTYSLLLIGGGGWLNEETTVRIADMQKEGMRIVRPGIYVEDDDLPALYSGAAALVHPALYEGFGLSPLQAMACGTPVIVSNNSSLPEVVGEAGLLIDAESESDISAKILLVLENESLQMEMKEKGLRRAKHFSWDHAAQQIYDQIIEVT